VRDKLTAPWQGGVYCENCEVARPVPAGEVHEWNLGDSTRTVGVMPYAIDSESAARLWSLSEQLLRLKPQARLFLKLT
jgi:hypothetical protein